MASAVWTVSIRYIAPTKKPPIVCRKSHNVGLETCDLNVGRETVFSEQSLMGRMAHPVTHEKVGSLQ